jgi:murein DD-endopeptidase MepM/ murein hydrolase activator NlpD
MLRHVLLATVVAAGIAIFMVTTEAPLEDPVWWYSNEAPPQVVVQGPAGPLRGSADAIIQLTPIDRARVVAVTVDGQPTTAPADARISLDSAQLADGVHRVQITARDTSRRQNEASATWSFVSENAGPTLDIQLDPVNGPTEGRTAVVRINPSKPTAELTATLGDRDLRLQPADGGSAWALVGVPPGSSYTSLPLDVHAADRLGNTSSLQRDLPVTHAEFPEDDLQLAATMAALVTPIKLDAESAHFRPIYAGQDGDKRWNGPFQLPVHGEVVTVFGTHRSYEYHPGVDFAVSAGTPVAAPAPGVVVYEGNTPLHGNTLILDHGAGIYTTYAHLQQFDVDPGQTVRTGDVLANVGSTGLSTGPHLHWELWVDGADVDAIEWTERAFP